MEWYGTYYETHANDFDEMIIYTALHGFNISMYVYNMYLGFLLQ